MSKKQDSYAISALNIWELVAQLEHLKMATCLEMVSCWGP